MGLICCISPRRHPDRCHYHHRPHTSHITHHKSRITHHRAPSPHPNPLTARPYTALHYLITKRPYPALPLQHARNSRVRVRLFSCLPWPTCKLRDSNIPGSSTCCCVGDADPPLSMHLSPSSALPTPVTQSSILRH
ncbi:hypothetical protein BKA56DRAFT_573947 [Ilyonectria sp. MPI-CAGE-AT-0026]|nr:hypothetical protein BKA56DRAFT_573947 [Ilyonectria sp. MPI-CAGE-AT-0026]